MVSAKANVKKIKLDYQQMIPNQLVTAIIVLDKNLTIQYANPASEALLLKSFNKLYGQPLDNLFINEPIKQKRLARLLVSGQEFSDSDVTLELFINHSISVELMASSVEFYDMPHILLELKQIDQQKIIIYNIPKHTTINFIDGTNNVLIADSALIYNRKKLMFHVQNNWIKSGLKKEHTIQTQKEILY